MSWRIFVWWRFKLLRISGLQFDPLAKLRRLAKRLGEIGAGIRNGIGNRGAARDA